jgi:hypothetical protein
MKIIESEKKNYEDKPSLFGFFLQGIDFKVIKKKNFSRSCYDEFFIGKIKENEICWNRGC